jgi:benzylsuccinate CoA-transferase BbsE subunit
MLAPLNDVRVIELSAEPALFAARTLALLGADVIHVEPPEGSPARRRAPFLEDEPGPERSLYHLHYNVGKRGITLDYTTARGAALLRRLVAESSILVETHSPGYMDSLGVGYEALCEVNPSLIYGTVTPFGQEGPMRDYRATDIVGTAMSGLMFLNGDPDDPPNLPGSEQAFHMASLALVSALTIALAGRKRASRGTGTRVDVSIQEAATMATLQNAPTNTYQWQGAIPGRRGLIGPAGGRSLHRSRDGRWISFVVPPYRWADFLQWLDDEGIDSEVKDEKFEELTYRRINTTATAAAVAELTSRHDAMTLFHEGQRRRLRTSIRSPGC